MFSLGHKKNLDRGGNDRDGSDRDRDFDCDRDVRAKDSYRGDQGSTFISSILYGLVFGDEIICDYLIVDNKRSKGDSQLVLTEWGTLHPDLRPFKDNMRVKWSTEEKAYVYNLMYPRFLNCTLSNFPVRELYSVVCRCQKAKRIFHANHVVDLGKFTHCFKEVRNAIQKGLTIDSVTD